MIEFNLKVQSKFLPHQIIIYITARQEAIRTGYGFVYEFSLDHLKSVPARIVIVKVAEYAGIDLNKGKCFLDHTGRIQDDTVTGLFLRDFPVSHYFHSFVGEEIHESLEETAAFRLAGLLNWNDAWGFGAMAPLEVLTPNLHSTQHIHETYTIILPATDPVMSLAAVHLRNLRKDSPG